MKKFFLLPILILSFTVSAFGANIRDGGRPDLDEQKITNNECIESTKLSSNGRHLLVISKKQTSDVEFIATVWDVSTTPSLLKTIDLGNLICTWGEVICCAAFNNGGDKIAIGTKDNQIFVYDINKEKCLFEPLAVEKFDKIESIDFSNDDKKIIANLGRNEHIVWNANSGEFVAVLGERDSAYAKRNNAQLFFNAVIKRADGVVFLFPMLGDSKNDDGSCVKNWIEFAVQNLAGTKLAIVASDGEIGIFDIKTIAYSVVKEHAVASVAFSLDDTKIIVATKDGLIKVYNVVDGTLLYMIRHSDSSWVTSITLSVDGRSIIVGDNLGNIESYPSAYLLYQADEGIDVDDIGSLISYAHDDLESSFVIETIADFVSNIVEALKWFSS